MTAFQILVKAAGLQTLWLGIASVVAGTAAAAAHGNLEPYPSFVCLVFAIFAQCTSNVMHRYFDAKHGYGENEEDDITFAEDINRPLTYILREGIQIFLILTATAGLALLSMTGWWTLIIAALLVLIVVICNVGPYPFSRSVFYPVATFLIFGPIAVVGTELVQSQHTAAHILTWWDLGPALTMGVIMGLMAVNCHVVFGVFHRRKNAINSRTTFFGRYGIKGATILLIATTLVYTVVGILIPVEMGIESHYLFLVLSLLSMALSFLTIYYARKPGYCEKAWRLSLFNIVGFAVLSLVIFCIVGYPEGYLDNSASIF